MQTYVSPVGYDSTRVTRPVLSHGLDSGDTIVLLLPEEDDDDPRSREAVQDIERMLQQLEPNISVESELIPYDNFQDAVFRCLDILDAANGYLTVNFGGGPREIYLALTVAVLGRLENIETVTQFSDINGSVTEISLPYLGQKVSDTDQELLTVISAVGGGTVIPELTKQINRSKSTITRRVNQLEDDGILRTEMHGKTKYVELTFTGEFLLRTR